MVGSQRHEISPELLFMGYLATESLGSTARCAAFQGQLPYTQGEVLSQEWEGTALAVCSHP